MVAVFLETAGFAAEEVTKLDLPARSQAELIDLLRAHVLPQVQNPNDGPSQRTIIASELEEALKTGWCFRHELNDGRILVEREAAAAR